MVRGKKLGDYLGKNEKTKIIVKITKAGTGAPAREPLVDQEAQIKMMSYYSKKQEDIKKLDQDNDDGYLESAWANPTGLKKDLQGISKVQWKFK